MTNNIKLYKKDSTTSYTSGAYVTIELLRIKPQIIECVYIHSVYKDTKSIVDLCKTKNVPYIFSDKAFRILNQNENSYILGVFKKYVDILNGNEPHIVLINPSDMGNLGTIIRTMAGLGIKDLAIIEPAADIFNPKTVRASMGALFDIKHCVYSSFNEYRTENPTHNLFPFMLKGNFLPEDVLPCQKFALVFGNEASGLDETFVSVGNSIKIPLTDNVDSFNLSVAAGIGMYVFARKNNIV